ncbi:hypothetical protein BVC80_8017g3 [Macleaya cordata]|uniref:Uncharacterized protein n=1 Tax=Macleaya cordata TaxID=56857 RepID=A0A200QS28_MACCD|nr:hypothetical protein BVC80_8017g3 [Macleaya cordata]
MVDDYDTGLQDEYLRRVYGLPLLPNVDDEDDCEPIAKRLKLGYVGSRHTKYDEGKLHNEYDRRRMHRNPLLPDENVQEYNEGTTDVERSKDSSNKRAHLTPMDFGVGGSSGVGSGLDLMATSFNKFVDTKLEHMKSIRDAMTLERNLSTRLFEELDKISGLSEDNVIDAASIILDSSTKTKIFFGMSDERRAYYVKSRILIPSLP